MQRARRPWVCISGPDLGFENAIYETFLAEYQERYGTEPTAAFHAHAYDATNILLAAVEQVAQVGDDGTLLIGALRCAKPWRLPPALRALPAR